VAIYPQLNYIAQGYFHQDYDSEADTALDVVRKFRDDEAAGTTDALVAEIKTILDPGLTEDQIREIWMDDCHACYAPTVEGISYRSWLEAMLNTLRER
jgi:hypothetical protein